MLNHRIIILTALFISLNLLLGCEKDVQQPPTPKVETQSEDKSTNLASGTVIESIDAAGYTYVQVESNAENIWLAGPKTTITQGGSIDVNTRAPMRNFHSKALDRDFPVIYFVDSYSGSAVQSAPAQTSASASAATATATATMDMPTGNQAVTNIKSMVAKNLDLKTPVKRAEDGQTIAEIYANKHELSGKLVKVRGKVSKFTPNVMNKNWIHIIDGSGENDLTVITDQLVKPEQMIVIEGTVLLDKDFGYGYFYELLIDNAKVVIE